MATRRKPARASATEKAAPHLEDDSRTGTGDTLHTYIREIRRFKTLSLEQEQVLARRIQQGDQEALNSLVEGNLRFVVSYAKRYRGMGLSFLDMIHEGNLGLIEAAKRFDPDRNVKFISYAVWWVRQAIFHGLSHYARAFRLPQKMSGQVSKVGNARTRLTAELQRQPTTAELARDTEMSESEVEGLMLVAGDDLSLSMAIGDDGSLELGDTLEQETVPAVELELIRSSFVHQIQTLVGELDEREREVLRMRFGLDGGDPFTLQEIGTSLGLSRERVRQIESKAKEKLRRSRGIQGLRGYLN